jgi:hypothetical protein
MINSVAFRAMPEQIAAPADEKYVKKPNELAEMAKAEASKVAKNVVEKVPTQYGAIEQAKKLDLMA